MNIYHIVKAILLPFIFINISFAQKNDIHFEQGLTWQQVKEKARAENKYIFVDCYATWCVPCKMMDKEVYTNDTVSTFSNSNFISVKVQMDTSKADSEATKKWYSDAHSINKEYKVSSYPTYLFVSPTGELVHKGGGYRQVQQFVELMTDALNPERQYYTLLAKYNQGIKDYSKMHYLISTAYRINDVSTARTIAKDYIENHLLKLKHSDLYANKNLEFIRWNTFKSEDKGFQFLYNNAGKIDKQLKNSTFVEEMAYTIISNEEVRPAMTAAYKSGIAPDWEKLGNTIKKKYTSYYSDFVITEAKMRWYKWKKDWPKYCKNSVKLVNQYFINAGDALLNDQAWDVFLHSLDKGQLESALQWTKRVITRSTDSSYILPNTMDTYANLIYKISYLFGEKKDTQRAIQEEEKAMDMKIKFNSDSPELIEDFRKVLEKMKAGIPTWTEE
nr:thioredoxin family protein [uncultured Sediminibacterium sp.]